MPATILVGIDWSRPSRSAVAWSVDRAAGTGSDVELLHVIDDESMSRDSDEWADMLTRAGSLAHDELDFARSLGTGVSITSTLSVGRPMEVLVQRSSRASLLVVGTHKTGFIYGKTFGSRFLGLGSRARCDVAFIPDRPGYDRKGVVVAADDQPGSDRTIRFAAAEAAVLEQELTIVNSWGTSDRAPRGATARERRADALARSVRLATESQGQVKVRTRAAESSIAEALIDMSAHAALLVIGRRRNSPGRSSARAANHDVLLNMSSPVIVVLAEKDPAA